MARDFIKVDTATTTAKFASELVSAIASLRETVERLTKVKGIMDHNQDGTVFTDIETIFGLPAGKGQTVYDYINGTRGALAGTFQNADAMTLIERVG